MFLYGKNSVFERLKSNPKTIKKVFLDKNFYQPHIERLIKTNSIITKRVSQKELTRIKAASSLQGIVAKVDEFIYTDFDSFLYDNRDESPSLIFLDKIVDPQNLGAMMRTAACFGNFAIVIPKHKSCPVTEAVVHVAQGGENFVPVAAVSSLIKALIKAKDSGYWAAGAVLEDGQNINEASFLYPLCFVLGSEATGIGKGLEKYLDIKINIPMKIPLSFNAAAACAIFCFEITRQSHK